MSDFIVPFCRSTIGEEEIAEQNRVLRSGWQAAGPETRLFEEEFAKYVGVKHAIFTNSCTSALKMAYKWLLEQEPIPRAVFYPDNTFCATHSAAREMGLIAVPFSNAPNPPGGLRVNVHYGGVKDEAPCLIEDSAHRIEPNDPLVGKIRCYSFYVTKNMTTVAGGMFVTNDDAIYERARLYWRDGLTTSTEDRLAGRVGYEVAAMAGGYDGNDVAAATGRVQLRRLPELTRERNGVRDRYNAAFGRDWAGNHLYIYATGSEEKAYQLIDHLKTCGVQAGYHYPNTGWDGVSLPIFPGMSEDELSLVIASVKSWSP